MKTPSISVLVAERLTQLGVNKLSPIALAIIEGEALESCRYAVSRSVSNPRIARAIAASLGQGSRGGTPLASSARPRQVGECVAGSLLAVTKGGEQ
jgi:hypothetical protein